MTSEDKRTILQVLCDVMGEVQSVGKTGHNQAQNYSFRGVDAVVNAVGPALRKHGVIILPHVEEASYREVLVGKNQTPQRECTTRVRYTFYGPAGDFVHAVVCGEALDSGDKATAKAFSVAYRICLLQALTIPTDELDPDSTSPVRSPQVPPQVAPVSPTGTQEEAGEAEAVAASSQEEAGEAERAPVAASSVLLAKRARFRALCNGKRPKVDLDVLAQERFKKKSEDCTEVELDYLIQSLAETNEKVS